MTTASEPGYRPPDMSLLGEEHIRRYRETDGQVGHVWNGVNCLILTTEGRRSHQPRDKALIYGRHGDNYLVIASDGGAPKDPKWLLNITANSSVGVQVLGDRFRAKARIASGDERQELWAVMVGIWPNYDVYTTRTTREIPLVVLEPE